MQPQNNGNQNTIKNKHQIYLDKPSQCKGMKKPWKNNLLPYHNEFIIKEVLYNKLESTTISSVRS